ncbi:hypothetical protein SNOG_07845 [Parastagonospora nodorum SN15]|uniref:Uncharacterized protein n=1 Tax=Phaeosphaeria nodorum (strain SN15 / ATCC MYA-4574 / FGSC 10173) TaxID=321614 RepID=Q0UK69_PHANO|nr:hypothetical protein SNOG_07845 [Parastagonospora nodorum SN15]EAT85311.1 hypothetical protein SNOG_07845 [Parastagonospora nodorum SN15]
MPIPVIIERCVWHVLMMIGERRLQAGAKVTLYAE